MPSNTPKSKKAPRTSVDFGAVRSIGMALPDVTESVTTWGRGLKVKGRLLACQAVHKSAEPNTLMVRIGLSRRKALLAQEPEIYYLKDHYEPYPAILVRLSRISRASLRELLTESWEFVRGEVR